jgi:HemK-related putative methylase
MHESIYQPAEDSFLMAEFLKKRIPLILKENPDAKIFEMGPGSGINLKAVLQEGVKKKNIFSADINSKAVEHCKKLGFNCVKSNLFQKTAKTRKYDVIIFNPPYLPDDPREPESSKTATTGGEKGNEIIVEFLQQAKAHLNEGGVVFVITSSRSEGVDFEGMDYDAKEMARKFLFYEKLFLWELVLS